MGLNELSGVLWRERQLLELLLFKLEEEQMILTTGRTQWLGHATREVEAVLTQIRASEIGRAVEADQVAADLGLDAGSSLLALAKHAPPPWDVLLHEHHEAFVRLTNDISGMAHSNRDLLATSHRTTQETLLALQDTVQTYDPRGGTTSATGSSQLLDQAL